MSWNVLEKNFVLENPGMSLRKFFYIISIFSTWLYWTWWKIIFQIWSLNVFFFHFLKLVGFMCFLFIFIVDAVQLDVLFSQYTRKICAYLPRLVSIYTFDFFWWWEGKLFYLVTWILIFIRNLVSLQLQSLCKLLYAREAILLCHWLCLSVRPTTTWLQYPLSRKWVQEFSPNFVKNLH